MERAKEVLELIHSDVCGPFREIARGGYSYFITFADDYSRFGYVYLMKYKHESFEKFKEFKAEVEKQKGKSIKTLRSDRGEEYMSTEFGDFLKEHGIVSQFTPPGTPQLNGVSERRNRTLLDMVRSMMSYTDLPISMWGYALQTACYLLNRIPSKSVSTTLYEIWNGRTPSLKHVKIWGCPAFVKKQKTDKLETRSEKDRDDPTTYEEAISDIDFSKWLKAMKSEMDSMSKNQVWDLVDPPEGIAPIGNKWIFTRKIGADGKVETYKVRLVAKGYRQKQGVDYEETFSLVAMLKSIRIMLAVATHYDYDVWQMDVKTAFLNGYIEEEIFMDQPKGFESKDKSKVCKLKRSIYGLKQASRSWNRRFDEAVKSFGFIKNKDEPCSLMYAMLGTRPDIAYAVSVTRPYQSNPGPDHWTAVKNILKYLRRTKDKVLVYGEGELRLDGFTNSNFQSDVDDKKSISCYIFTCNGGAVSWKSSKQETTADSTSEAEYIAASDAAKEAIWIRKFVTELYVVPSISSPVELYCDNTRAIAQAKEPISHQKSKHIERRYHIIREIIGRGDVAVQKVASANNVADPLTKAMTQ
ncbi:hypothetical protein CRG98_021396 [Punica granatum]|uniref:Integrase catalytic domain-containing protein n=1 Tax=Punica granatum TaxID=22663 RepID=A0A2I0JPK5_PUNGR|nr:hypothetical protein CRG98_021396 [Punica granatum]